MARITLYVSDDLKRCLGECGDKFNYSEIAQQAFRRRLAQLAGDATDVDAELPCQLPDAPGVLWSNGGVVCLSE